MNISEAAESIKGQIIEWRREFHQNPELTWEEVRTGNRVAEELERMGIEAKRIARTGVLGIIRAKTRQDGGLRRTWMPCP